MDFKVSYLDAGLTNSYFSDSDQLVGTTTTHHPGSSTNVSSHLSPVGNTTPQRVNRRYKTQLRDFLSTCRTKRKLAGHHHSPVMVSNPPTPTVDYIAADSSSATAAAAVAAAYNMYSTPYPGTPATDNGLSGYMGHSGNFHQTLYDNRFLTTTENLFHQYRPLGTYYTDYHHAAATTPYVSNGFLDMSPRGSTCSLPTYETTPNPHTVHQLSKTSDCDKLYTCHQPIVEQKYAAVVDNGRGYVSAGKCLDVSAYGLQPVVTVPFCDLPQGHKTSVNKVSVKSVDGISSASSSPATNGLITPKLEDMKTDVNMMQPHYSPTTSEAPRQTVLMWGSGGTTTLNHTPTSSNSSCRSPVGSNPGTPIIPNGTSYLPQEKKYPGDPLKSLAEMNSMPETKWKPETPPHPPSPKSYYHHHQYTGEGGVSEVYHQFYPYHHHHQ